MSSPDLGTRGLEERVQALSTWAGEIAERVRATEVATGDEKTAKELRRALELVAKHDPKLESRLTNRIDVLADRLDTLASAVSTTSSELARRDGEIAALRREHERDAARLQAFEQERTRGAPSTELAELRKAVATLSTAQSPRAADEHVARLVGKVDYLTERVDTLAKTVATTAAGLAGREGDLAALRQRLDERAGRLELGSGSSGNALPSESPTHGSRSSQKSFDSPSQTLSRASQPARIASTRTRRSWRDRLWSPTGSPSSSALCTSRSPPCATPSNTIGRPSRRALPR